MSKDELSMMAHLMRRAGFGATRDELETRLSKGYEATVEELLNPEEVEPVDIYEFLRYQHLQWKPGTMGGLGQSSWVWHRRNSYISTVLSLYGFLPGPRPIIPSYTIAVLTTPIQHPAIDSMWCVC